MAEHEKSSSGKGIPPSGEGRTAEPQVHDARLIPGGSLTAAKTPIGMNAVDREDLPAYAEPGRPAREPGSRASDGNTGDA